MAHKYKFSKNITIEAMMLSCATNAKEKRYVVVSNFLGAFLWMDDIVHMIFKGTIAKAIIKLDPTIYRKRRW